MSGPANYLRMRLQRSQTTQLTGALVCLSLRQSVVARPWRGVSENLADSTRPFGLATKPFGSLTK